MIELVPAKLTHVGPIATQMRAIDRLEAEAMGRTPKDALRMGLRASLHAITAMEGRNPVAMMGVVSTSLISGQGLVWLLGTDRMFAHGRALLTLGPPVIAEWHRTFPVMENVVATCNHRAIRLLARWGAIVGGEVRTMRGVQFIPFRFERSIQGAEPLP